MWLRLAGAWGSPRLGLGLGLAWGSPRHVLALREASASLRIASRPSVRRIVFDPIEAEADRRRRRAQKVAGKPGARAA